MSKFLRELLIGIAITTLGIVLSVSSRYVLFYGLIVFGLFMVALAFVHLSQSKQKDDGNGAPVKKIYPTDRPLEKVRFIENLNEQEELDTPKQMTIGCSRNDQAGRVWLNGMEIGRVTPDASLSFQVTRKNNVINISEKYEGICFFHVVDDKGIGELKIGMGMQSAAVKVVPNTGLAEGIIAVTTGT